MYILGISAFYHDSAACLIRNGEIVCAVQEERFTRIKHDSSFPKNAINSCIDISSIDPEDIEYVVFYEKPFLKFERLLETYLAFAPKGFRSFLSAMPIWLKDKLFQKSIIIKELENLLDESIDWEKKLLFSEHHLSHAASAFYPSPFEKAAILTLDGVGEWTTTSLAIGSKNNLIVTKEIHFPHSIGLLYSAFTYYAGFRVNSGEYKLMGLAPYGEPKYADLIKEKIISVKEDGSFHLDMSYFNYCTGLTMTSKKFHQLFNRLPRKSESELSQFDMDIAASIQKVTEEIIVKIAKNIAKETGEENLCLAGGVALNCVANGIILKEKIFKNIWIQPAAGDAGGALGAALAAWHLYLDKPRNLAQKKDKMKGSYLGPKFSEAEIKSELEALGAKFHFLEDEVLIPKVAESLKSQQAIGWMQGKMEFGPRALGGRSIIGDARSPLMQKQLNLKVKYRESFRPFAPSVIIEKASEWFEIDEESPYMLLVAKVKPEKCLKMSTEEEDLFGLEKLNIPRSSVPAITHVDYSARIQTVHKETNPKYHSLISKFYEISNCPVIINTSFNVRGEPIVHTPKDAFKCFMGTELDMLVIENFLLIKNEQEESLKENYKEKYTLD